MPSIYLGVDLTERPIYLDFFQYWFPSLFVVGSPGCVWEGQKILTFENGELLSKTVGELYSRQQKGRLVKVLCMSRSDNRKRLYLKQGYTFITPTGTKETFKITTKSGKTVVATPDHKFFVTRRENCTPHSKNIIEKTVNQLHVGDSLVATDKKILEDRKGVKQTVLETLVDPTEQITSITSAGKKKTYDFSVPEYHNLVLANGILSHNSWKSLSSARTLIETLLNEGWIVTYVTITPDWMGIQHPNCNPLDVKTLKLFHTEFFDVECHWHTWGVKKSRVTVLLSPFWRGNIRKFEQTYGLTAERWSIPVWNVMLEALSDFYGGDIETTQYFKDLRELWENLRAKKTDKTTFLLRLEQRTKSMGNISKKWAERFINRIERWFDMRDPILTTDNMLEKLLKRKGSLIILHFPEEEITAVESATLATFIYTLMDVCGRLGRKHGLKYAIIIEDVGVWCHHQRMKQALETLIQRKGRKMNLLRVLIGQTEGDLRGTTIKDTRKNPTFDFRIDATINPAEINGERVLRGSSMFLHLRKQVYTRQGPTRYPPLLFISRPPLTAYQLPEKS